MRDQLPAQLIPRLKIIEKLRRVFELYGYQPLETPAMERLEVLMGKYGEEGDKLTFLVMKRGDELQRSLERYSVDDSFALLDLADQGLRYDLTVPLARVIAQYQNQLPMPFKRYQIGPVWRADRPQYGRYREFIQCDVDIVGSDSPVADAEIINLAIDGLTELGFADFDLPVNHRGLLAQMSQACGNSPDKFDDFCIALDKLDKIGHEGVEEEMQKRGLCTDRLNELWQLTDRRVSVSQMDDCTRLAGSLGEFIGESPDNQNILSQLLNLFHLLEQLGIPTENVVFDPSLARGLDYYTGLVFEAVERGGSLGSLLGGGRYDELIGMFVGRAIPAVGFSFGLERIVDLMTEKGAVEKQAGSAAVQIIDLEGNIQTTTFCGRVLKILRNAEISCELGYHPGTKAAKQIQQAVRRGFAYVIFIGSEEIAVDLNSQEAEFIKEAKANIKRLEDGVQRELTIEKMIAWIKTQTDSLQP